MPAELTATLAIALALAACQTRSVLPAPYDASATPARRDPWVVDVPPPSDDPPGLNERHRFAEAACPRVVKPYFFRVEKAGRVSYLLGTRHVSVPLAKLPAAVSEHARGAKLAVFEVAPGEPSTTRAPPIDLDQAVGPALWKHYNELVGSTMAGALRHGRPAMAYLTALIEYEDPSALLDGELERAVADAHVKARGLESAQFQSDTIDSLLDVRALRAMIQTTKDRDELEQESAEDLAKYCAGDDDHAGLTDKERAKALSAGYTARELDDQDKVVVFDRNAKWIPELVPILDAGNAFIAVGADHLKGPHGVVALLHARGYTITRVTE
ncbi:MAG TPA: TraB/GumN family protein [Kofleriaceae bacterium]|jgi:hypothetical protein